MQNMEKTVFNLLHTPKEDEEFLLKPMNCPHHCEIYNITLGHIKIYLNVLQNLVLYIDMNKVVNYMA